MSRTKLRWRVAPALTGPYRSFQKRGWPGADYPTGETAVALHCPTAYYPAVARSGEHAPIRVSVAEWHNPRLPHQGAFTWRTLARHAVTLDEAKDLAQRFIDAHPDWRPPATQTTTQG